MSEASFYPGDWIQRPLGEVCQVEIGGTPSRSVPRFWAEQGQEGYPWVAISDLGPKWIYKTTERITRAGVKNSNVKLVPKGTVLMSFKLTLGRVGIAGIDLYTNEAIAAFYSDASRVTADWLYHILPRVTKTGSAEQAIKGQTLNKDKLQRLILPLPSLPEQRCIAAVLDTAGEAIRQTERLIIKLKAVKAGLLHDLLTRGLDEHGHLRDPEAHPEQFKDSPLGRIPREWELTNVGSLGIWKGGSTPSKSVPSNWNDGNIVWISPKDVRDALVTNSEDKITEQALNNSTLNLFEPGNVIVVFRSGILRHTFPVAVVQVPFTVNQDMKVLLPRTGVHGRFAFWSLQGIGSKVLRLAVKAGTTVESIDAATFYNLPTVLPSEEEQAQIADVLDAHDTRIRTEEAELAKLRQIKRGLMDDLLTGKVRVASE